MIPRGQEVKPQPQMNATERESNEPHWRPALSLSKGHSRPFAVHSDFHALVDVEQ